MQDLGTRREFKKQGEIRNRHSLCLSYVRFVVLSSKTHADETWSLLRNCLVVRAKNLAKLLTTTFAAKSNSLSSFQFHDHTGQSCYLWSRVLSEGRAGSWSLQDSRIISSKLAWPCGSKILLDLIQRQELDFDIRSPWSRAVGQASQITKVRRNRKGVLAHFPSRLRWNFHEDQSFSIQW